MSKEQMMEASAPLAAALMERAPFDHSVTLRDHVDAALIIREFIAEHEGELTPEIEALLLDNENQTKEKVTSIGWFVKTETARIEAEKALIANLQKRVIATTNRVEWLKKSYLMEQMQRLGMNAGDSLKGAGVTVRFQYNNPKLDGEVAEERVAALYIVPTAEPFVRHTPESFALDKVKLLAALKAADAILTEYAAWSSDANVRATKACPNPDDVAKARVLRETFPELTVVRDLSVRIG